MNSTSSSTRVAPMGNYLPPQPTSQHHNQNVEQNTRSTSTLRLFGRKITIEKVFNKGFIRMGKERSALRDSRKGYVSVTDSWYFLLLDSTWRRMVIYVVFFYVLCGFVFTCISLPFTERILNSTTYKNEHVSERETALVFSVTHVVTMGYGQFFPYDKETERPDLGLFFLASSQQFCGVIINVLVFTIVVTKLQHPMPAIVFAKNALVTTRNNLPVLLFRIGNLRCNHIYMPTVRVSMLKIEHMALSTATLRTTNFCRLDTIGKKCFDVLKELGLKIFKNLFQ
ncbi:unnamed protein product [Amoebophrya sp. A120]|nr:unnamed protein product [Amoebophrya sp. A120]|eukprot:GSA120T00007178001.1